MDPTSFSSAYLTIQHILSILIVLVNGFLLVALVKKKALRTPSNAILGCLSCSDLLIGIVSFPLWRLHFSIGFVTTLRGKSEMFNTLARVFYILTGLSSVFMILVNLDRYAAICQPFRYIRHATPKLYAVISICTCVIYVSIMTIAVVIDTIYHLHSGIIVLMIILLTIASVLVCCNRKIIRVIRRHRRTITSVERQCDAQQGRFQSETRRYYVIVLLIILYVLFKLPSRISLILIFLSKAKVVKPSIVFYMVSNVLLLLNSVFNPLVYCFRIRVFRGAVREIFYCKKSWT